MSRYTINVLTDLTGDNEDIIEQLSYMIGEYIGGHTELFITDYNVLADGSKNPDVLIDLAKSWNDDSYISTLKEYFNHLEREYKNNENLSLYETFRKVDFKEDMVYSSYLYALSQALNSCTGVIDLETTKIICFEDDCPDTSLEDSTLVDIINNPKEYKIFSITHAVY